MERRSHYETQKLLNGSQGHKDSSPRAAGPSGAIRFPGARQTAVCTCCLIASSGVRMEMRRSFWAFCYCFLVIIERLVGSRQQKSHNSPEIHTHSLGEKSDVYIRVQSRLRWTKFTSAGRGHRGLRAAVLQWRSSEGISL